MKIKDIREKLMAREDVIKVKITRSGEIHAYVDTTRGDGGRTPWWQLIGTVDRAHEILGD